MRLLYLRLCLSVTPVLSQLFAGPNVHSLALRQDSGGSAFPILTTGAQSTSVTSAASTQQQSTSKSTNPPITSSPAPIPNNGGGNNSSSSLIAFTSIVAANASTSVSDAVSTTSTMGATPTPEKPAEPLPLPPRITPALSIAGTILIITGVVYLLIGVKNRLIHVFLSTAYLTSLATLVLVLYVVNPPVKDAIQGAYFVGIFMCGIIFGGGALIFQDITEGLGCLLGGFALSMWFLTLKPGGLLTSLSGKAIFIAAFCVICWSLSFSHYTRAYGLIGSTSFAGSVALVLGIDCFAKAGYKEFWVYLWELNENLFPLNTSTYPMTRGIRVELVIVILGTIVGVISQVRLWRLVRDRQKAREAVKAEDERRRDAVEEALGRHLERQNDKDRSEWEKRYGDRLTAKRNTILWSEAHGDKRLSSVSNNEVDSSHNSDSVDSVEMAHMQLTGQRPPVRASKSMTRQSNLVQPILEVEEDGGSQPPTTGEFTRIPSMDGDGEKVASPTLRPKLRKPSSKRITARVQQDNNDEMLQKRTSMQSLSDLKRISLHSMRPKSRAESEKSDHEATESVEALVHPPSNAVDRSRASSVAATFDEENEDLEIPANDEDHSASYRGNKPPQIAISFPHNLDVKDFLHTAHPEPPSPSGISDAFEDDPEAVVRVAKPKTTGMLGSEINKSGVDKEDSGLTVSGAAAEGLTKGALEKVPSQMSNVVLSYRTNEWAKHITTAEAPIFEEPDPVSTDDNEEPTHLAPPQSPKAEQEITETSPVVKPPELPLPVTSVESSESGLKINPAVQPVDKASTQQPDSHVEVSAIGDEAFTRPVSSSASVANAAKRSFTDPVQAPLSAAKALPRASNVLQRQPTLRTVTIDENSVTKNFNDMPAEPYRSSSSALNYGYHQQHLRSAVSPSPDTFRSPTPVQHYSSGYQRQTPTSAFGYQNYSTPDLRPATAHSSTPSLVNMAGMRSETRLSSYNNSHQPLQRQNTNDSQRREVLMADWREQMSRSGTPVMPYLDSPDIIHNQLIYDSRVMKARQEAEKVKKAQRDAAMDQTMRTQSMIDAHREVMKRMQSQANKTLGK